MWMNDHTPEFILDTHVLSWLPGSNHLGIPLS